MAAIGQAEDAEVDRSPERPGHVGLFVVGSLLTGLLLALVLSVLVFGGDPEPVISGAILLAFAVGWAMLALLTIWRTGQPQRWAWVPAIFMGVIGLAHLIVRPTDRELRAFGWAWPIALVVLVVWMTIRSRRALRNWSRPVILYPLFVVMLLAAFGGGYETFREARDNATFAMSGQLIDVGGHKLHISCTGTGSPTVILQAGLGEPGVIMAGWIQPAVANTTKVCVYDRAGKGWSTPAARPQDGHATAADLHTLLSRAHVDGPYVLAGHSSGGVYVQVYAAQYPDQVAGMVLLDSQPSDVMAKLPGYDSFYRVYRKATGLAPSAARLGLMRLVYQFGVGGLPPKARAEERAFWSKASQYRSLRDELLELPTALTQAQALKSLGDKPLNVVTAAQDAMAGWMPLQDEMVELSTNSVHRVIQTATHAALIEDQNDSKVSSQAILDVVTAVRTSQTLTK
jgi:pimeloyl-ACP methyl ester carboxylesterase